MREVVIAYDLGTGGIKSSVVSADGEILCSAFVCHIKHIIRQEAGRNRHRKNGGML